MSQNTVKLQDICISNDLPITLIAGPCVLENYDHAKMMVEKLLEITETLKINFIYKTSYDKANRTSLSGIRGTGLHDSLKIFSDLRMSMYDDPFPPMSTTALDTTPSLTSDHACCHHHPSWR